MRVCLCVSISAPGRIFCWKLDRAIVADFDAEENDYVFAALFKLINSSFDKVEPQFEAVLDAMATTLRQYKATMQTKQAICRALTNVQVYLLSGLASCRVAL